MTKALRYQLAKCLTKMNMKTKNIKIKSNTNKSNFVVKIQTCNISETYKLILKSKLNNNI